MEISVKDLGEAQYLAEKFFRSQGNPEEITLTPNDFTTLLGFAVIAGRKLEGMPSGALTEDVAKEVSDYAWTLAAACFKACEPPGAATIVVKRPDLAQNVDEDLLIPLLATCVCKGREMQAASRKS